MSGRTWTSTTQLQLDTARYQRRWWHGDAGVAERAAADPALATLLAAGPLLLKTVDVYRDATRAWPARADLHDRLTAGQIGTGGQPDPPAAYFTIGCVGAGKTRVLRPLVHAYRSVSHGRDPSSLSRVAADEVRQGLPEYEDGLGSAVVQDEAFAITYSAVFAAARAARLDLVYDTIGILLASGVIGFEEYLRLLKSDGYLIHLLLVHTPLHLCVQRAEQRALTEDGRLVEPQFQHEVFEHPRRLAPPARRARPARRLGRGRRLRLTACPPDAVGSDAWSSRYHALLGKVQAQAAS